MPAGREVASGTRAGLRKPPGKMVWGVELGDRRSPMLHRISPLRSIPMSRPNHLSRSFSPFDQQRTLVVEIEMSQSSWLVSGIVPGVDRQPLKKLDPDENALLRLLQRWRGEAGDGRVGRAHRCRLRSRPGGLLARTVAPVTGHRGARPAFVERRSLSGAPSSQARQARYRVCSSGPSLSR